MKMKKYKTICYRKTQSQRNILSKIIFILSEQIKKAMVLDVFVSLDNRVRGELIRRVSSLKVTCN